MTEWVSTSTGELIDHGVLEIGDGYRAKNAEFTDHGIPFLRIGNLGEGRLLLDGADLFPEENLDKVFSKLSEPNDCVIATKATIGRLAYLDESSPCVLYSPQVSYWRVLDHSVLEPRFIRCWLVGREFEVQAFQTKSSTSMADYINLRDQRRMRMTLPPLDTQRKIAAIVAAYDELIENNLRRIEILEEMAQAIYREWFVNFRFPGHTSVAMVESPLGPIPVGWSASKFGDIAAEIKDGVDPKQVGVSVRYVGLEHLPQESFALMNWGTAADVTSRKWRFISGDVLFGKLRPYFHKVVEASFDGICSTDVIVIRPVNGFEDMVLQIAFSSEFVAHAVATSGGTDRPRAKWADLENFDVVLPNSATQAAFSRAARPMIDLAANLVRQNTNLRATRDLLLPKLVSGELDVSDLDIDTERLAS